MGRAMTYHIVQLVPELNQGGVERGVVELSRELVLRGHRSTVISAGGRLVQTLLDDGGNHVQFDVCSKNPLTVPRRVAALRALLADLAPSVVHARSRVPAWLSLLANRSLNLPFITTVHGFNSVNRYSAVMTRGDRVLYGSHAIRDYILAHYRIDESKLRYVPRGIDLAEFDPDAVDVQRVEAFRREFDLAGKFVVTCVGRITGWKGQDTLIRAMAAVRKLHPDTVALFVGNVRGDRQETFLALQALAAECGVAEAIRFAGSQSALREIYALSDLVVSAASTKPETFGRATAEALAMNRPVIASAHGGSLDIVRDGINGLLFEPGNHDDLARKIAQARAMTFSSMRPHIQEHFSLERMTQAELDVCRELVPCGR